ncbi:MAG: cytochrome c oxidase subunit I [Dehalococcoidia bacterium]|jgi:cytochrome c oxidase subunit 1|nr:cytochrome c oxidase subunit I [Dehalococcoidia bacterium]
MATAVETLAPPATQSGIWSWITTIDHKRIGALYAITGFIFFLVGGVEALLIRAQLAVPNGDVIDPELFNQLFGVHALTMIFLAVMPMGAGFFNYMIPLMIGARDVAFPRLNALSYWIFLGGALLLTSSFIFGGAPDAGWFAYAPLTSEQFSPGRNMDFYVLGILMLGVSSMAAALNFAVTIINMRAPGMSLLRMPVFVWMTLIISALLILALPPLTVALLQLLFDRHYETSFLSPGGGGDPLLWQHLFWVFGHPEVYILILPAMGIVSETLPVFSRKPLFGYSAIVFSGMAIAFLGWAVWSHHMYTTGLGPVQKSIFAGTTMTIGVPTGIKIFNWLATMYGGSIRFTTSMYFAVAFIALFTIGGISGVMHASPPIDTQQQDTYWIVAHIHYVLVGGALMGIFSGIYYWFPKMTGRFLGEGLGQVHFWLMFIGINLTFFPMHFLGTAGMPRRIYTYDSGMGWDFWNMVATIGALVIGVSLLVFIANFFRAMGQKPTAPNNPWDAATLEWATTSPPPEHDFDLIPIVRGRDPLWFDRDHGHAPAAAPDSAVHIHLPPPSYYPMMMAVGVLLLAVGPMTHLVLTAFGAVVIAYSVWGWALEPTD